MAAAARGWRSGGDAFSAPWSQAEGGGSADEGTGEEERPSGEAAEAGVRHHRSSKKSCRDPGDPSEERTRRRERMMAAIEAIAADIPVAPLCWSVSISRSGV